MKINANINRNFAEISKEFEGKITTGRWPANFILIHKEECELKGTKKVKSNGHWTQKANIGKFYEGGWSHQEVDEGNKLSDDENNEEVADWDCVEDCPVKEIGQQSGILKSGVSKELKPSRGGASRFFKQFKRESK